MGVGLHPNTDSSMASFIFYLGRGNLDDSLFLGGSIIMMGKVGSLVWGGGGGELPLHLPWINPSARRRAMNMCMPLALSLWHKPACSDPPQTILSELGKENKPFSQ